MCNLSQVAIGARYLKGVDRVLLKSNMCSIWGATETTSQQRADEANSNERGGGQRTSNSWRGEVNAAKWKLAWKPRIRVFKRAQWRKIRKEWKYSKLYNTILILTRVNWLPKKCQLSTNHIWRTIIRTSRRTVKLTKSYYSLTPIYRFVITRFW